MLFQNYNFKKMLIRFIKGNNYYNFQDKKIEPMKSHKKWSNCKERKGNALAPRAEEGRD